MRAVDKIIEGLTQLLEGFVELQSKIEKDFEVAEPDFADEADDSDIRVEIDAAMVTEIRATIESVMDAEDYSADEIATFLSVTQDALEEIDPDVFESDEDEDDDEATTSSYSDEIDEDGYDDDIYDDDDYEEEEEEDEEDY